MTDDVQAILNDNPGVVLQAWNVGYAHATTTGSSERPGWGLRGNHQLWDLRRRWVYVFQLAIRDDQEGTSEWKRVRLLYELNYADQDQPAYVDWLDSPERLVKADTPEERGNLEPWPDDLIGLPESCDPERYLYYVLAVPVRLGKGAVNTLRGGLEEHAIDPSTGIDWLPAIAPEPAEASSMYAAFAHERPVPGHPEEREVVTVMAAFDPWGVVERLCAHAFYLTGRLNELRASPQRGAKVLLAQSLRSLWKNDDIRDEIDEEIKQVLRDDATIPLFEHWLHYEHEPELKQKVEAQEQAALRVAEWLTAERLLPMWEFLRSACEEAGDDGMSELAFRCSLVAECLQPSEVGRRLLADIGEGVVTAFTFVEEYLTRPKTTPPSAAWKNGTTGVKHLSTIWLTIAPLFMLRRPHEFEGLVEALEMAIEIEGLKVVTKKVDVHFYEEVFAGNKREVKLRRVTLDRLQSIEMTASFTEELKRRTPGSEFDKAFSAYLSMFNLVLAVQEIQPKLDEKGVTSIASAVAGLLSTVDTFKQLVPKIGATPGKIAGAIGGVLDLITSFHGMSQGLEGGDYSVAVGHALAACTATVSLVTLVFFADAFLAQIPVLGWTIGAVLTLTALLVHGLIALTTDSPMEKFANYCEWGERAGQSEAAIYSWTCNRRLGDWHHDCALQLRVLFNILGAFEVNTVAPGAMKVMLRPGALFVGAVFRVEFEVEEKVKDQAGMDQVRKLAPAFLVHARPVEQLEPRVSYAPDCPAEEVQRFKPDPVTPLQVFDLNEPGFSMLLTVIGPGQVKSARVRLVLNGLEVPYEQQWRVPEKDPVLLDLTKPGSKRSVDD